MTFKRELTEDDHINLMTYEEKCQQVKDYATACLAGTHTGLMLFGSGGNGKSYSIRQVLNERNIKEIQPSDTQMADDVEDEEDVEVRTFGHNTYVIHQGRITPKGLVKMMAHFPESLHLIEDAETMFDDKNCWGVLRMATASQDKQLHTRRRVTWTISTKGSYDFYFSGSLIVVGNRQLPENMAEVDAQKTRCPCVALDVTNAELTAKMKELCEREYKVIRDVPLNKKDCYDVMEYMLQVIENDHSIKYQAGVEKRLNLRILDSGFRFMALSRLEPSISWKDMLHAQLAQVVMPTKRTRTERVYDERKIAQEVRRKKWPSQVAKLVEYARLTGRDTSWADKPKDSDEYKKGFHAAKQDFKRKAK